jgi:carbohydrate-selective porin OprB
MKSRGRLKMKRSSLIRNIALVLVLAATGVPSFAEQSAGDSIWTRDKLTGDWGGLRTDLSKDHGVDLEVRYSSHYQNVISGGVDTGHAYANKIDSWLNVDMNKLFGTWEGLYISAHMETRHGSDVLGDAGSFTLPNANLMYPLPGDYHGNDVTSLMVTQMLFDGKAAVLGGKLGSFDLLQGMFPNVTDFGLDGFMNANSMMSILSWGRWLTLSQYGAGAWTIKDGMPSTGVIVTGATNTTTTWSATGAFSDGFGMLLFHRFLYDIDGKKGYVYVGAGGSTVHYPSLDPNDLHGTGNPADPVDTDKKKPWGLAVYVSQILWQAEKDDDKRRVHLFAGGSIADDNPSFSDWDVFASVQTYGLFASRPKDRMGIAGHYYHFADDYVDLVNLIPGENLADNSWTTELFYNYEINQWLHLTPNLQYVQNEQSDDDPAVILGTRLVVDF